MASKINKPIDSLMALFKLVFFFTFVVFNNFVTTIAQDDVNYQGSDCSGDKITPNSAFQLNLRTLLSYLSSNATGNREFYNTTVTGRNHSDTVYGMFMCWGDIPAHLCSQCVKNVTQTMILYSEHSRTAQAQILSGPGPEDLCSLYKQGIIQYDECMVRYSNHSFFSMVDLSSPSGSCSTMSTASNSNLQAGARFEHVLSKIMNEVADEAANFSIGAKKYATKQARISDFQTLYCQVQCTPDLSPQDCRKCLNGTVSSQQQFCKGNSVGTQSTPSCNIRCDVYPFYRPSNGPAPSGLIPVANHSDSKYSQDPGYLSHNCSSNETMTSTAFLSNLRILFSSLSSNATTKAGFFKTTVDGRNPLDTVHGLFMCRSDVSPAFCQLCILNATTRISLECSSSKEAIIWFDHCLLRYSNRSLSPTVETSPKFHEFDMVNSSNPNLLQSFFTWTLAKILNKVVETETRGSTIKNYRTRSEKLNDQQTLYILAQCTPDLFVWDCSSCLQNIFQFEIPWSSLASPEGKVLYPSCFMMFGISQFYQDGDEAEAFTQASPPSTTEGTEAFRQASPPTTTAENEKGKPQTIIVVVPIILSAILFSFCCCLLRKKAGKSGYKTFLKKNFGDESTTLEGLQFNFTSIKAATNNFSHENKIGKGGFGEVYKGILYDGRHIAVKRLSTRSKQGLVEFKNEILLIAKLQQRNLVTLIGFCLEKQEKILIYEYVPNGSLDYFLFDAQQQKLSWSDRYKIIGGTALGILYLHEYSRLKVIHRDLKPSNVLLDENMNPKISDFGMARIVEIDQDRGNTNRIAGTYGYMSPEYAMLGQFSEKSDVFSFGVMILEIITGKRNINSYESHHVTESLISYVWKQWKKQTPLSILDPNIKGNYSQNEVIKCIEIGLLCVQDNPNVRPTMATIISYLNSTSLEFPYPQEPTFFLYGRVDQEITSQQESSSVNEMSMSEFYPRQ